MAKIKFKNISEFFLLFLLEGQYWVYNRCYMELEPKTNENTTVCPSQYSRGSFTKHKLLQFNKVFMAQTNEMI